MSPDFLDIDFLQQKVDDIEYPHMLLSNISVVQQVDHIPKEPSGRDSFLEVPVYAVRSGEKQRIGYMPLTATGLMRLQYVGVLTRYYESEHVFSELQDVNELVSLCTFKELMQ